MSHLPQHPHIRGRAVAGFAGHHTDHRATGLDAPRRSGFRGWLLPVSAVALAMLSAVVGAITTVSTIGPVDCRRCDSGTPGAGPVADLRPSTLEEAAARAIPSVVKLETEPGPLATVGSGIVLTADGLILTSRHVLAGAVGEVIVDGRETLSATFADGRAAPLTIVGTDLATDVAVVHAEGISGCAPITIGSSEALRVGQSVVAVGSPLGLANTVTSGVVSALHRPIPIAVDSTGRATVLDTIQTDTGQQHPELAVADLDRRVRGLNCHAGIFAHTTDDIPGDAAVLSTLPQHADRALAVGHPDPFEQRLQIRPAQHRPCEQREQPSLLGCASGLPGAVGGGVDENRDRHRHRHRTISVTAASGSLMVKLCRGSIRK